MHSTSSPQFSMHVPAVRWAYFISVSRTAYDIPQHIYPMVVSPARSFLGASYKVAISFQTLLFLSSSDTFSITSLQWRLLKVQNRDGFPWCPPLLLIDGFSDGIEREFPLQPGDLENILALGGSLLHQQQKHESPGTDPQNISSTMMDSLRIQTYLANTLISIHKTQPSHGQKYPEQRRVAKQNTE